MNHSQRSSVSSLSDNAENECYHFMLDRVSNYQPLNLQSLTGHLSSLPANLRSAIGKSKSDLRQFLENYPDTFAFDKKENVYLVSDYQTLKCQKRDSSASSYASSSSARAMDIINGKGKITRLFPVYGFLAAFSPINTSVYFTHLTFGDPKKKFSDYNLKVGDALGFDAKKKEGSAEYCATRTWILREEKLEEKEKKESLNPPKKSSTSVGDHRKAEKLHEKLPDEKYRSVGFIQNVYDKYGFIEAKDKSSKRVFFHLNKIRDCGYITDLRKFLKIGNSVEYTYSPSVKRSDMYEATNVWLNKCSTSSEDELYVSSSELSEDDQNSTKENHKKNDDRPSAVHNSSKKKIKVLEPEESSSKLLNQQGKIYPNSDTTAEIRFGNLYKKVALAETCPFYVNENQVVDLMWEFNDGDIIMFDATKVDDDPSDPVWQVDLVWVGKKPDKQNNSELSQPEATTSVAEAVNHDNDISTLKKCSKYTSWGDSPFLDETEQDANKYENDSPEGLKLCKSSSNKELADEILSSSSQNSFKDVPNWNSLTMSCDDLNEKNNVQECSEKPNNSNLTDKTNDDFSDDEFTECFDKESSFVNQKSTDYNSVPPKKVCEENKCTPDAKKIEDKESHISMYQGLKGVVEMVYRSIIQLSCRNFKKPVSLTVNDFYYDGVSLSDRDGCLDPREVIFKGDEVRFNCFEVTDDDDHIWQKVTMAWKGKKPKAVKEVEPKEFIEKQHLKVSGKIPSWESYTEQVQSHNKNNTLSLAKDESMRLLKQSTSSPIKHSHIPKSRHLPAVQSSEVPQNSSLLICKQQELQDASGTVPPVLVDQFLHITNKISVLHQNSSGDKLKDIESLSSDMDAAIKLIYSLLNGNNTSRKYVLVDACCQTDNLLMKSHTFAQEEIMQNTKPPFCKISSAAVQTFSTGEVIVKNIFPQ